MKYINLDLASKRDLAPYDVMNLITIEEGRYEDVQTYIVEACEGYIYEYYKKLELVEEIKAKNKAQPLGERIRLSKKGRDWIRDFFKKEIEVSEDAELVFKHLQHCYSNINKESKVVSASKTKKYIQEFMNLTSYTKEHMYKAIDTYFEHVKDDFVLNSDNLFFKLAPYQKKLDLADSRLYDVILKYLKR